MKNQYTEQHKTKIIQLQTTKKTPVPIAITKMATVLLFGFFISLSLVSDQIFLREILLATAIISLALISKEGTSTRK